MTLYYLHICQAAYLRDINAFLGPDIQRIPIFENALYSILFVIDDFEEKISHFFYISSRINV